MARLPLSSTARREALPGHETAGSQHLIALVVVIAALYFGREVFIPIALAILLSFALAPPVSWLRRRRVPRVPAVIVVVLAAFVGIAAFGAVVATQVSQLAENLPRYQTNIQQKIRSLRESAGEGGAVERASEMLKNLSREIEGAEDEAAERPSTPGAAEKEEPEPLPVEVHEPEPEPIEVLQTVIGPLISPIATAGIVIVFVIFMLLQREDLRDRFIRLAGVSDLQRTTQAISDAGKRVGRYLLMQLVVNVTYGVPVGIGLWLIGVPNPLLWGMLAIVLRFVPYVGPIIAAMFPLALAIAVDPGWTMLLWTIALFVGLELISNNIIEPWLYGSSTGLSPVAIIVAAIFWTWLWGPIGLLLSTPLTVCLVVLGRHVPQFAFLDVLLGSEPVLTPPESLYQRLLANDPDEATERAEEFLEEGSLLEFYDDVAIPALTLVEHDRARGVLSDERRAIVVTGALTLVDNLSDHEDVETEPETDQHEGDETGGDALPAEGTDSEAVEPRILKPGWDTDAVLCAGARGNLDDAAAAMLAQLLEREGIGTRLVPFEAVEQANYATIDFDGVQMVCLSYMNSESLAHARYLVRRLRRRTRAPILVGLWSMAPDRVEEVDLAKATRANFSAITLKDALDRVFDLAFEKNVEEAAERTPERAEQVHASPKRGTAARASPA